MDINDGRTMEERAAELKLKRKRRKEARMPTNTKELIRDRRGSTKPQLAEAHYKAAEYLMRGYTKEQALLKAGYAESTAKKSAWTIFDRQDVKTYIERRRATIRQGTGYTVERIKEELAKIAFFNIGGFIEITREGDLIYDFTGATMEDFAAIGEVTIEDKEGDRKVRVKPYDKIAGLTALGRIHGLFTDNLNVTTTGDSLEERLINGRRRLNKPEVVEGNYTTVGEHEDE